MLHRKKAMMWREVREIQFTAALKVVNVFYVF